MHWPTHRRPRSARSTRPPARSGGHLTSSTRIGRSPPGGRPIGVRAAASGRSMSHFGRYMRRGTGPEWDMASRRDPDVPVEPDYAPWCRADLRGMRVCEGWVLSCRARRRISFRKRRGRRIRSRRVGSGVRGCARRRPGPAGARATPGAQAVDRLRRPRNAPTPPLSHFGRYTGAHTGPRGTWGEVRGGEEKRDTGRAASTRDAALLGMRIVRCQPLRPWVARPSTKYF
jgi:hypothetical protein